MEYVGDSIGSCLARHGKFDEEVTKSFTSQILDGLEYLHGKGILHRDLKAHSILVDTSGVCKIANFGISKQMDDDGAATLVQGPVFWMVPEVVNPKGKAYNFKIDIWSVGCVILEMWTGSRPWLGDEALTVMLKLCYDKEKQPPV
jgi:serine/threonine protein kinase